MFHVNRRIIEVNNEQHEDMPEYDLEYEKDDETQVYDSETENGEGNDINYKNNLDSAEEIQNLVPIRSKQKRGMTQLPKMKTEHVNSSGRRKTYKV
ncbi:unnamed protein product [Lactuca saligna]|uniref:Uncharacterized protein n=1 Tax=Lactuca saligna TaxID=75948 RepID=A0AA36EP17_LACSI|nr:unnamed protein product [Lactuca saligna]